MAERLAVERNAPGTWIDSLFHPISAPYFFNFRHHPVDAQHQRGEALVAVGFFQNQDGVVASGPNKHA